MLVYFRKPRFPLAQQPAQLCNKLPDGDVQIRVNGVAMYILSRQCKPRTCRESGLGATTPAQHDFRGDRVVSETSDWNELAPDYQPQRIAQMKVMGGNMDW
jgi:hypothetical protein